MSRFWGNFVSMEWRRKSSNCCVQKKIKMVYLAIGLGTLLILSKSAFLWLNGSIAGSGISEGGELKKIDILKNHIK